jgi:hypothetical protein
MKTAKIMMTDGYTLWERKTGETPVKKYVDKREMFAYIRILR